MEYRIYHLDCGPLNPVWPKVPGVTYVLLVETNQGWLLVDSGFGTQDFSNPSFMMKLFFKNARIPKDLALAAVNQINQYGLQPMDVQHIVLTHLHLDHAGGLRDFPWAQVHVYQKEINAAIKRKGLLGLGCLPLHWAHRPYWHLYEEPDNIWFGFPSFLLKGFEPEIHLIPTPGHTPGHCMVAVQTKKGWLLQCGDAAYPFYLPQEEQYVKPPQIIVQTFLGNHKNRIKQLLEDHGDQIEIITSHDPVSWVKHQI